MESYTEIYYKYSKFALKSLSSSLRLSSDINVQDDEATAFQHLGSRLHSAGVTWADPQFAPTESPSTSGNVASRVPIIERVAKLLCKLMLMLLCIQRLHNVV